MNAQAGSESRIISIAELSLIIDDYHGSARLPHGPVLGAVACEAEDRSLGLVDVVHCNELMELGAGLGVVDEDDRFAAVAVIGVSSSVRGTFVNTGTGEDVLQPMGLSPVGGAGDENDARAVSDGGFAKALRIWKAEWPLEWGKLLA